jgi:hypothetical protein
MKLAQLILCGASALWLAATAFAQSSPGSGAPPAASGSGTGASGSGGAQGSSSGSSAKRGLQVPKGTSRSQYFNSLDANRDGSISKAEAEASPALVVIFVESDTNADGQLSRSEFDNIQMQDTDGTAVK